ncbi:hypothetical protein NBRC10512_003335 [Rhodotorula toruloides]|uniref:Uncharacterized protein n=1 Tax=Rhodotorula toruloides (strain NP11) TaxID=1130832 RepID=M7WP71_RHOT1|nr:uncharacterized protein RHTO_01081 [Rhodotorula toruloides NP11]EMS22327.1 hypothetical protein RHTO_01081 [Rhodotorula toruloides NP11]
MLRIARQNLPWRILGRASYSATPSPPRPPVRPAPPGPVPVDDLCIPLEPTYSLSDYLPADSPSLPRETLLKLHKLAALQPPTTEEGWKQLEALDELVAVVQAVRDVDTSALGLEAGEMVDARVRAEPEPVDFDLPRLAKDEDEVGGQALLKLASRTEGAYYVAPMPENVRTKKRNSTSEVLDEDERRTYEAPRNSRESPW